MALINPKAGISSASSSGASSSGGMWEDAPLELTRRCVMMEIAGETDSGRTTLALTAPGPIAYIHGHEKKEGAIQIARRRTLTRMHPFRDSFQGSSDQVQSEATKTVKEVEEAVIDAYNWARSIVIDTHTSLWVTYQLARLGSMTRADRDETDNKKGRLIYQEINNRWQSMLKDFSVRADDLTRKLQTNLIIIGQMGEEYKGNSPTGRMVPKGQKGVGYACDVRIATYRNTRGGGTAGVVSPVGSSILKPRDPDNDINAGALESEFTAVIEKPWYNNDVRGLQFPNVLAEDLTFAGIMSVITDTDRKEWE